MRRLFGMRNILGAAFALSVLAAACSNGSTAAAAGGDALFISAPTDGAKVSEPFAVQLNTSVPIGDPSTGEHHVHLCFDGASCDSGSYQLVYANSAQVTGLAPGQHTIEASLRNADHSAAGSTATITVTVTGAGATSGGSTSTGGTSGGSTTGGYGY